MKTCSQCNKSKPVADFNRAKARADGRQGICRDCSKRMWRER